ncbi:MAG: phosphonate ABC transporter, permease protein PhnE [Alphaproteobacteria bacterium]|nr:phosphonate ABC transporter, permease protein PhnE [Alphaproteobacteria bacterium]
MTHSIHTVAVLPAAQLAPLANAYGAAVAAKRRQMVLGIAVTLFALALAALGAEVEPQKFWAKLGNFTDYFARLAHLDSGAYVWTDPVEWFWGLRKWLRLIGETMLIAYIGTFSGALVAFCACFMCSANLTRSPVLRATVRRLLEFCRTVPDLVFALIFVVAFGLGPLPGVMALAIHTAGALGKLFAEVVDNIDLKPVEGIAASGGSWFAQVRFGVVPQVLANFTSYALLRFEINVRGASVIGFVGAGGIGEDLLVSIRRFYYADVSAILLVIIACVMLIDVGTEFLRHRLVRMEGAR